MKAAHEEVRDIFVDQEDERFSCPKAIRKKAMDFLARREYGQSELIKKLSDKGYVCRMVELGVIQLTEEGLQCDQRFSESFVQSRINQGKGPVRIRLDLAQKGVSQSVIEFAIEAAAADWFGLARDVRQRKFGEEQPADFAVKAKQMRFLQYRGFEQDHVQAALRRE